MDAHYAMRYLAHDLPPLSHLTLKGRVSEAQLKRRLHSSRAQLLRTSSWPAPPCDVPLIAIADAIWQWINKVRYTLYLILLKPLYHTEAIICLPLLKKGEETSGWPEAFEQLPSEWKKRVFALICDGNVGMISYARHHHWLVQRCHAHLRRYLNNYISRSPKSRHRKLGEEVHTLATILITSRDQRRVAKAALRLREIYHTVRSRSFKKALSGLIKHTQEFRTYLEYPELDLPTTTNAVESLNSMVRELLRRTRGFRTLESFLQWVTALLVTKKTITCNGHFSTK